MALKYFVDPGDNNSARCLVWQGPLLLDVFKVLEKEKTSYLRLSSSGGWNDSDISLLKDIRFLKGIEVYSPNVKDISVLETCSHLEYIGLDCPFSELDFSAFPNLKTVKLRWRPKAKNLFAVKTLEHLNIINYPFGKLEEFESLHNLQRLQLTSRCLASLEGIKHLRSLKVLDLFDCRQLKCLSELRNLSDLENLELSRCKGLKDITEVSGLKKLKRLILEDCGTISTLTPLTSCSELSTIGVIGNTVIDDGEFYCLLSLPKLKSLWFQDRRHYKHKYREISRELDHRARN
jgi:Leucine-rich repeat (LRR) protein